MRSPQPFLLVSLLTLLFSFAGNASAGLFDNAIQQALESGELHGVRLQTRTQLRKLYDANGNKPLWNARAIRSLAGAIESLNDDGLTPSDYRFTATEPYLSSPSDQVPAEVDILLSESFLRGMLSLYFGKADPEQIDPNNNFGSTMDNKDRSRQLVSWIQSGDIGQAFTWARPDNKRYQWLREALAKYREIQAQGGWPQIPKGGTIKPGSSDSRIPVIRKRLFITGDLDSPSGSSAYDKALERGVKAFQARHYLDEDGVIGPAVQAAMNVPVKDRIDQIRVNLERQRWLFPESSGDFLVVDIAGFKIYWISNHEIIWKEQVQIGQEFTKTPVFKDKIRYIDFNPTWTIPPGIMERTMLPKLRKDPGYLDKLGYQVFDNDRKPVDPRSVDWAKATPYSYKVVQPPGEDNALGLVKFMFPNKHHVFLHDTNHRDLFAKHKRTTSSGCIRLHNPFDLAERLLRNQGWDRARIDGVIASGKTTTVKLEKPMPILIHYNTAWAKGDEISFKTDIYKRDAKLLAALDGPFVLSERALTPAKEDAKETRFDNSKPLNILDL